MFGDWVKEATFKEFLSHCPELVREEKIITTLPLNHRNNFLNKSPDHTML